jgi:hypothetical protein
LRLPRSTIIIYLSITYFWVQTQRESEKRKASAGARERTSESEREGGKEGEGEGERDHGVIKGTMHTAAALATAPSHFLSVVPAVCL